MGEVIRVRREKPARATAGITTIGLDLGDRLSQFSAIDAEGATVQGRVATTVAGLKQYFGRMAPVFGADALPRKRRLSSTLTTV